MPRVIWTPRALQDVARLHRFLAPKNRDAARRAVSAIRQGVRVLASSPEIGRPAADMPPGFRERVIQFGDGGFVAPYLFYWKNVSGFVAGSGRGAGGLL